MSFLKSLGKIGDVVGSTDFLTGLATGAGKEIIRQERASEKKIENDLKEGRISIRAARKKYNADLVDRANGFGFRVSDVEKTSGEIIYIDNRAPVDRTSTTQEDIKVVITL